MTPNRRMAPCSGYSRLGRLASTLSLVDEASVLEVTASGSEPMAGPPLAQQWRCHAVALASCGLLALACENPSPPGTRPSADPMPTGSAAMVQAPVPTAPSAAPSNSQGPQVASAAPEAATPPPHPGPWLTVLSPSAAVYAKPSTEGVSKLGYVQSGARIGVTGKPKPGDQCKSGWLEIVGGGFICSAVGTLDEKDSRTRFTIRRPALDSVLPYTYARNAKNGTPLYRTVPTAAQMQQYEPYLKAEAEKRAEKKAAAQQKNLAEAATPGATPNAATPPAEGRAGSEKAATEPGAAAAARDTSPGAAGSAVPAQLPARQPGADAGVAGAGDEAAEDRPWWQRDGIEDKLHELRLSDLKEGADSVLALRMVKGFYIAVDRTFSWNGRTWYKSTKGLVAPADRMGQAAPSDFHGVELTDELTLPLGWVYGGREKVATYELDLEKKRAKPAGSIERFVAIQLTTTTQELANVTYQQLKDGKWIRKAQVRITEPGEPPKELKPDEPWVDVDLSTQTLVVLRGTKPVYATLISSGKSSRTKDKDHSTPTGQWRIREKHITTTMDGDGTAAGDQPYSIEDVPFVMYFHKSYAIHGAFWHRNYGVQMSHGCVNLAPLDAKAVFFMTEPHLSEQWHGRWSSAESPGSWVVVHE